MAYEKVNPNFQFGGHWFSKKRYGICIIQGARYPLERGDPPRIVYKPDAEPAETADPLDWDALFKDYLYWRERYRQQGYTHTRYEVFLNRR